MTSRMHSPVECHRASSSVSHVFHFLNFLGEDKDIGDDHILEYETREILM